jgi:hypothetical protein
MKKRKKNLTKKKKKRRNVEEKKKKKALYFSLLQGRKKCVPKSPFIFVFLGLFFQEIPKKQIKKDIFLSYTFRGCYLFLEFREKKN